MRILYFSPRNFWPPNSGAPLRDYYLLRELASRASVSFLGLSNHDEQLSLSQSTPNALDFELDKFVIVNKGRSYTSWKLVRGLLGPTPVSVLNYHDRRVATELRRLLHEQTFDVVQMEGIHLISYLPILRSSRSHPLLVCDWHDVQSELMLRYALYTENWARRLYAMRTASLLGTLERRLVAECDAHLVVSERDRLKLREMTPKACVHVVENGVEANHYSLVETQLAPGRLPGQSGERLKDIVFVGSMDSHANIDAARYFALEVWPRIRAQSPELRFLIVGSRPVLEVRELANLPGVTVTGTVEDVRPYYCGAFAAVAPLRIAGGTRLKILEAMAAGVSVISTSVGAEGLAVNPGANILIADTVEEMARVVWDLYNSHETQKRLSRAGRELVRARYDWSVIGLSLYHVYRGLLHHQSNA